MQGDAVARTRGFAARVLPAMGFAALCAAFVFEIWRHIATGGDFWTLWAAARAVAAGVDPYRTALLHRIAPLPPGPAPGSFLSPLFTAELMWPFGALPFAAARLAWLAVNAGASVLLLHLVLRASGFRPTAPVLVAGAALLMAFQPYDITLWLGQTDVLVAAALAVGWWCLSRGRPVLGGLAVALAAVDVHLLLGFGFYFVYRAVARREYRPLLGLAAGLAVLGALCLLHPADTAHWLLVTLPHAQASAIEPWDTLSVLQAASELLGAHSALAAVAPIDAGLLLLAVAAFRRPSATPEQDLAVAAVLTLATTTFAYNQDYLLLVLAVPFLVQQWRRGAAAWWTGALAFCLAAGFGLAELTGGPVAPSHAAFIVGAPLLALAVLAGLPGVGARLSRGHRFWAGAWAALTVGGYAAFTWSRWEVGPELLMLAGLLTFMALVGLRGAPGGVRGVPGRSRGLGRRAAPDGPPARIPAVEAAAPASGRGGGTFAHALGWRPNWR